MERVWWRQLPNSDINFDIDVFLWYYLYIFTSGNEIFSYIMYFKGKQKWLLHKEWYSVVVHGIYLDSFRLILKYNEEQNRNIKYLYQK